MISEIKKELKKRKMETIGVISYDATVFLNSLKGNALSQGRATREAGVILDFLLEDKLQTVE